ncbi:MAG: hypothetical protein ABII12_11360 [Planctomycetota bacterium]
MSKIHGAEDLPDFGGVRPLIRPEDLADLDRAIKEFETCKTALEQAAQDAKRSVDLTLAWIGVGEKVVALVGTVLQGRMRDDGAAEDNSTRLTDLQSTLNQIASLHALLKRTLPGLPL